MSLGYTRDSLADLQKYYNTSKEIDDDYLSKPPAATTTSSEEEEDDFLFFDGEEEHEEMINTSPSVVDLMKLNGSSNVSSNGNGISNGNSNSNSISDNKSKPLHLPNSNIVIHKPLSRVTSTTAKAQTETKTKTTIPSIKVKATTTTTTTKANTTKAATNTKTIKTTNDAANNYYAGFEYNNDYDQYDNYDSYYMDPYGINQAGSFEKSNTTTHPKRNLFCCLFPYASTTTATAAAVASSNDATTATDDDGNDNRIKNDTVVTDNNNDMEDDDDDAGLDSDMSIGESHHGLGDDLLSLSASSSSDHSFESAHEDETDTTAAVVTVTTDKTTPTTRTTPTTTNPVTKTKTKEDTDVSVSVSSYNEQQLHKSTDESTKEPVVVVSNKTNKHQTKTNEKMEQTQTSVVSSSSPPPPLHDVKRIVKKVPVPLTTTKPDVDVDVDVTPLKSILKRTVVKLDPIVRKISHKNTSILNTTNKGGRRSILPSYENTSIRTMSSSMDGGNDDNGIDKDKDKDPQEKKKNRISFSPMARVISVMARDDMSYFTKSLIWWQRNDYDDFKKTGRIIAKAMLCGGSEIWLQTSNAWGKKQGAGMVQNSRGGGVGVGGIGGSSKGIDGKDAVSKQQSKGEEDINEEEKDQDVGLKWWCKFGHSRRGLEHIVTIEEGRQRQRFVNTAVRAVLDEQRRQRLTRKDTNKIAAVAMQYTSWARDLALAAGAADAEAVQSNFHSQAKCRIHHLRRNLHGRRPKPSNEMDNVVVPTATFILSANSALTAKVLDANTHAHSSLRKKRIGQDTKEEEKMHTPVNVISRKAAGFQFQSPIKVE